MNYYKKIKFLVMDVDGTLTDGKIYMGNTGEVLKAFDIKDGCGIKEILPLHEMVPVIITARSSKILETRCEELSITELHQGCRNKIEKLGQVIADYSEREHCTYSLENVAYIGDDIIDIPCMEAVHKAGGLSVSPFDAVKAVKNIADYICTSRCGEGSVREFIDWIVAMRTETAVGLDQVKELSETAYDFIIGFCPSKNSDGRYDLADGAFANVMSYTTKPFEMTCYETHRKYSDIQFIIYGTELMLTQDFQKVKSKVLEPYLEESDVTLYNCNSGNVTKLCASDSIVLHPNNAHRGAVALDKPMRVRKIVVKIPVQSVMINSEYCH